MRLILCSHTYGHGVALGKLEPFWFFAFPITVPRMTIGNVVNQKCSLRNGQCECNEPKKKA